MRDRQITPNETSTTNAGICDVTIWVQRNKQFRNVKRMAVADQFVRGFDLEPNA